MSNEIKIDGKDNVVVQNVGAGAKVEVTQILAKSDNYNDLLSQLAIQQELFVYIPKDKTERRLQISAKINQLTDSIEQCKREVLQLAEQFNRIEIDTERLRQAREFFEKGEFGEARALLNDDEEEIQSEEEFLWAKRESYKEIETKLKEKAEERLIQALLNQSNYANPNWFADTCQNFERSIKSDANKSNVFQYAVFLQNHNQFAEAEKYYSQYLDDFAHQLTSDEKAATLNNLAILHELQNDYEAASKEYEEVLQIRRALAEVNPNTYLPDMAAILNNLAVLHRNQNNYEAASKEFEEALQIRRGLAEINPNTYLPDVAETLNNLAVLHQTENKFEEALKEYEEALQIKRALAEVNPNTYLPNVALTLNNLAVLHQTQKKFEEASKEFEEALQIRRTLAQVNPNTYLPDVAITLNNLAILHRDQNNYEAASKEFEEALQIRRGLAEINPNTYLPDVAETLNNLAILHVDKDEFEDALQKFEESTAIYRELTVTNFHTYFPRLAANLGNLALFYQIGIQQREKSIAYAIEAIMILLPYDEKVPFTQEYFAKAWKVLQEWNLSDEDIQRLIDEKMEETGENHS